MLRWGTAALSRFFLSPYFAGVLSFLRKEEFLNGLRLLLKNCDPDIFTSEFQVKEGKNVFSSSLLGIILRLPRTQAVPVVQAVQIIIEHDCDLEIKDYSGKTPLLYALYRVNILELNVVVKCLLNEGADSHAVDDKGSGALHLLLGRLLACHSYYISPPNAAMLGGILSILLKAGCDPLLRNHLGFTPSDYALTPAAWVLWCDALRERGYHVAEIIQLDDVSKRILRPAGPSFHSNILHIATAATLDTVQASSESPSALGNLPCSVCERNGSWQFRASPFDLWGSHLATFGYVRPLHRFWLNHPDGMPCSNVYENGSCQVTTHVRDGSRSWNWLEFSWRKHAAYKLWNEGIIDNPKELQTRVT